MFNPSLNHQNGVPVEHRLVLMQDKSSEKLIPLRSHLYDYKGMLACAQEARKDVVVLVMVMTIIAICQIRSGLPYS